MIDLSTRDPVKGLTNVLGHLTEGVFLEWVFVQEWASESAEQDLKAIRDRSLAVMVAHAAAKGRGWERACSFLRKEHRFWVCISLFDRNPKLYQDLNYIDYVSSSAYLKVIKSICMRMHQSLTLLEKRQRFVRVEADHDYKAEAARVGKEDVQVFQTVNRRKKRSELSSKLECDATVLIR